MKFLLQTSSQFRPTFEEDLEFVIEESLLLSGDWRALLTDPYGVDEAHAMELDLAATALVAEDVAATPTVVLEIRESDRVKIKN